jgi:N6-adenosine-specific RNA methylase IME4
MTDQWPTDPRQMSLIHSPGGFRCFSIDPPWAESGGGKIKRGADRHYPLIRSRDEIVRVIKSADNWRVAENAHCYEWVTNNFLKDGLYVMEALGFRYVTNAVWIKVDAMRLPKLLLDRIRGEMGATVVDAGPLDMIATLNAAIGRLDPIPTIEKLVQIGLGQYFRGAHEIMLFGVRGDGQHDSVMQEARNLPSVIFGRRGKHSKKPDSSYRLIESRSKGPYAEIFARSERPGWTSWGNEIVDDTPPSNSIVEKTQARLREQREAAGVDADE